MYTYCVTFRISDKTVNGVSYRMRLEQLMDNVYSDQGYWDETTSFLLVESNLMTFEFAEKAFRGLSSRDDIVVVFDPSDMSSVCFGPIEHLDVLRHFFPGLKKAA